MILTLTLLISSLSNTDKPKPVAWWSFNEATGNLCTDSVNHVKDKRIQCVDGLGQAGHLARGTEKPLFQVPEFASEQPGEVLRVDQHQSEARMAQPLFEVTLPKAKSRTA
jgi:hypothetical protein